jgi:hypothetical protein
VPAVASGTLTVCRIAPGNSVALTEGQQILLARGDGGRLVQVQIANHECTAASG